MINGLTASSEQNILVAHMGHLLLNNDSNINYDREYSVSKFAASIEFWGEADMTKTKLQSERTLRNLRTGPTEISSSIKRNVNFCT